MTTNADPGGNVPLTANGDVSLATITALIADEPIVAPDETTLDSEFAPSTGRVAIAEDTDDVYLGDGSSWIKIKTKAALTTSRKWQRRSVVSSVTTLAEQGAIQPVDTSGSTVTVTLASAIVEDGAEVVVKDEQGNAGTNAITVDTEGSETIDGGSSQTINSNYGVLRLYSDGTDWYTR